MLRVRENKTNLKCEEPKHRTSLEMQAVQITGSPEIKTWPSHLSELPSCYFPSSCTVIFQPEGASASALRAHRCPAHPSQGTNWSLCPTNEAQAQEHSWMLRVTDGWPNRTRSEKQDISLVYQDRRDFYWRSVTIVMSPMCTLLIGPTLKGIGDWKHIE